MEEILHTCCGLDVHRDSIVACILKGYGNSQKKEIITFSTKTVGLKKLADWLNSNQVKDVVMESTGVYWQPAFRILEDQGFNVMLANPYHVKNGKGRKTDVKDSEWLCKLFKAGSISASFIPPKHIRQLRDLVRHRQKLIGERARIKNRIIKYLESCNIKLATVFTDVFGYTSSLIISKLISGERDPKILTSYIHRRVKANKEEIQKALEGHIDQEDTRILELLSTQLGNAENLIRILEVDILKLCQPYQNEICLLKTMPGVGELTAIGIISEIGVDMKQFGTHERLASWAALCPGNHESAGKQKSGRIRRGNNYIKRTLLQAAWAAAKAKNTYLQSKYKALAARKSAKKAAIAIAHKMLVACFYMLRDKKEYKELGPQFLDHLQTDRKAKYHVKRLEELGFHVQMIEKVKDEKKEEVYID